MPRKNLSETLKGGTLLLAIIMVLLLVAGGLLRLWRGPASKGPAMKVQVNIAQAPRDAPDVRAESTLFGLPDGAVDLEAPVNTGPDELQARLGDEAARYLRAGFVMQECRHFAIEGEKTDAVKACEWLMSSAEAAFSVYAAKRPNRDSLQFPGIDRGYLTTDGFNVIKGSAYFEVSRDNSGDASRHLALMFLERLAASDFGPQTQATGRIPAFGLVAGSERIEMPDDPDNGASPTVSADYSIDGTPVRASFIVAESAEAARAMVDAAAAGLAARGARRKVMPDVPSGVFFFVDGQLPVAVGSDGATFFRLDGRGPITAVAILVANIFNRGDPQAGH